MKNVLKYVFSLSIIFILVSCRSTATPIVYDKKVDVIREEGEFIQKLIDSDNFEKAQEVIEDALRVSPKNKDIKLLEAWMYLKKKEYQKSEEVFLGLLKSDPKNPLAFIGLARINRILGKLKEAKSYVNDAKVLKSDFPILWFESGLIDYEQREYDKALIGFSRAYFLDRKNMDALFFRFLTQLIIKKELDDIKYMWDRLKNDSVKMKSWYFLYFSNSLFELEFEKDAVFILEEGLQMFPDDIYLLNYLAYVYVNKYNTNKDEELLNKSYDYIVKCLPAQSPEILDTYFTILKTQNKIGVLKGELNKYLLLFPNSEILKKWIMTIGEVSVDKEK